MVSNDDKFSSIDDLYKRVLPAIRTKVEELNRIGYNFIDCLDIWNYCVENKWRNKKDLRIYEIVENILNIDNKSLENYVRSNIVKYKNIIDKDEKNER